MRAELIDPIGGERFFALGYVLEFIEEALQLLSLELRKSIQLSGRIESKGIRIPGTVGCFFFRVFAEKIGGERVFRIELTGRQGSGLRAVHGIAISRRGTVPAVGAGDP